MKYLCYVLFIVPALWAGETYRVVIAESDLSKPAWKAVADELVSKHDGEILSFGSDPVEVLGDLKKAHPRYTCFVAPYETVTRTFVSKIHQLTREIDEDPYTDTIWGVLTGFDAANALAIASTREPLTVRKVGSGTEFAMDMVEEGAWYDELVIGKMVMKKPGGDPKVSQVDQDTTRPLVDLLNTYKSDLFITSGHATERNWQIGYRYKNGYFISRSGTLIGRDMQGREHLVDSPNPKVYLPIGNCLMSHIKGADSMALAWMNSAGVRQMVGYTVETWFGYGGWGLLDYFLEQPGRYTMAEANHVNHLALLHKLATQPSRGLRYDRDVVVLYGDPAWEARMADRPKAWEQSLDYDDGLWIFNVTPGRAAETFEVINNNGAQRGGRPIVHLFPHRLIDIEIVDDNGLNPTITDDFILVPLPGEYSSEKEYKVTFTARSVMNL